MSITFPVSSSLDARMTATNNRASGFDYLRLWLSLAVILWHSYVLSHGQEIAHQLSDIFLIPAKSILICFFALSGFLVAGSLWRCKTLFSFLGLRVVRIVPALFIEVTISALILGPLVTTLSHADYFSSHEFQVYFQNILGIIHFTLPGVFETNPFPKVVNGQLWTIPWEFKCYLALALLALFRVVKSRILFAVALVVLQIFLITRGVMRPDSALDFVPGEMMVMAFLYGVAFNVYRHSIPYSKWLLILSIAGVAFLLHMQKGSYFAALPLTYITIYVGLLNPNKGRFIRSGDYSYGLYLYGFPIQQVIANLGPNYLHWQINFVVATAISFVIAYFSWNYIELPTTKLRSKLLALEEQYIRVRNWILNMFLQRRTDVV